MEFHIVPVTNFQQNCSVLVCPDSQKAAVVDPGGDIENIIDKLKQLKVMPEKILVTHAHLDHYGLISVLPKEIPIYCGKTSSKLIELSKLMMPDGKPSIKPNFFKSEKTFQLGSFNITPYLMDHSALDAYGFLVEHGGVSVFYTGDFRGHGRKKKLFERFLENPPSVDYLLMEGTVSYTDIQ